MKLGINGHKTHGFRTIKIQDKPIILSYSHYDWGIYISQVEINSFGENENLFSPRMRSICCIKILKIGCPGSQIFSYFDIVICSLVPLFSSLDHTLST